MLRASARWWLFPVRPEVPWALWSDGRCCRERCEECKVGMAEDLGKKLMAEIEEVGFDEVGRPSPLAPCVD